MGCLRQAPHQLSSVACWSELVPLPVMPIFRIVAIAAKKLAGVACSQVRCNHTEFAIIVMQWFNGVPQVDTLCSTVLCFASIAASRPVFSCIEILSVRGFHTLSSEYAACWQAVGPTPLCFGFSGVSRVTPCRFFGYPQVFCADMWVLMTCI